MNASRIIKRDRQKLECVSEKPLLYYYSTSKVTRIASPYIHRLFTMLFFILTIDEVTLGVNVGVNIGVSVSAGCNPPNVTPPKFFACQQQSQW